MAPTGWLERGCWYVALGTWLSYVDPPATLDGLFLLVVVFLTGEVVAPRPPSTSMAMTYLHPRAVPPR